MPRSKHGRASDKAAKGKGPSRSHKTVANKPMTRDERLASIKRDEEQFHQRAFEERVAWLKRPRLHTAVFAEVWENERLTKELEKCGARVTQSEAQARKGRDRAKAVNATAKQLGWSAERLTLFNKMVSEYQRGWALKDYLEIRRTFPELEIQVSRFGGIDPVFALEPEFKKAGIDSKLVAAALDTDEPSVDALSLRLLERLVERSRLPTTGPGHIDARRDAISDSMINYLIVTVLEGFDWHEETFRVPASLIVLITHQLCGSDPDLHKEYRARERRLWAAMVVGDGLGPNEAISVGKLAKMIGIPRSTAGRWLADPEFRKHLEAAQRSAATGLGLGFSRSKA